MKKYKLEKKEDEYWLSSYLLEEFLNGLVKSANKNLD